MRQKLERITILVLLALLPLAGLAQWRTQEPEILNLAAIVDLQKQGMDDDILVVVIKNAKGVRMDVDTSTDGLIAMKKAGLSDRVISAIIQRTGNGAPIMNASNRAAATGDPAVVQNGKTTPLNTSGVTAKFVEGKGPNALVALGAAVGVNTGAAVAIGAAGASAGAASSVVPFAYPALSAWNALRTKTIKGYSYELVNGITSTNVIAAGQPAEFSVPLNAFQDGRYAVAEIALVRLDISSETQMRVVGSAKAEQKFKPTSGPVGEPKLNEPIKREVLATEINKANNVATIRVASLAPGEYAFMFVLDEKALPVALDFTVRPSLVAAK